MLVFQGRVVSDCDSSLPLLLFPFPPLCPLPLISSPQREKRWSISSAGGEKNSLSVSRGVSVQERGMRWEGNGVGQRWQKGMDTHAVTAQSPQPSLRGIKLGLTAALPTLLLYKMFLRQHLACKLAPRLCLLYSFYQLSGCYMGRMIIRPIMPPSALITIITHLKGG